MKLQDRNLSQGINGDDVKLLQKELRQLGLVIADAEVAKNFFGETTRQAVVDFQKAHGLPVDGIVGVNTAKALSVAIADLKDPKNGEPKENELRQNEPKPPSDGEIKLPPNGDPKLPEDNVSGSYVIHGEIRQTDKLPAGGLIVSAFSKDASGSETKLGESVSDNDGLYEINYPEVLFSKLSGGRKSLDMVLRVFDPTHKMNQGWSVVRITQPVENLDPRDVSWLPW